MLDIKVSAALMMYNQEEQRKILDCVKEGVAAPTVRLQKAVDVVNKIYDTHVEVVEGYAGFPIEKELIQKNKQKFSDDRNIGRVISQGGNSLVITGKKSDGRYSVVGKKGEKTAKRPEDLGLNFQREHIDIEDLHQLMMEKMDGKDDNGFKSCWKGYKKQGTKMKGGKEVNNCVKEEEEHLNEAEGSYGATPKAYSAASKTKMTAKRKPFLKAMKSRTNPANRTSPYGSPRKGLTADDRERARAGSAHGVGTRQDHDYPSEGPGGVTKSAKKLRKQKAMGEFAKEDFRVEYETFLEEFIDFNDPELDTLTFEELEEICTEALLELDEELLTEALDIIDGMTLLSEDRYADAVAKSKENAKKPEVKAGVRNLRKEKVKAALKSAASSIKKGATKVGEKAGSAVGKAANVASATKSAVKSGGAAVGSAASKAGSAVGSAASKAGSAVGSAASKAASGAKKVAKGAGEVAGAAAGGFRKGYADARGKSSGSTRSATSGGSSGTMSSSEVGKKTTSSSEGESRVRLRDKIKSGIKKAVGSVARKVSRGARNVARRLGEQKYSWRTEMGIEQ